MCWLLVIFRMLFAKVEPVCDEEVYTQANKKDHGFDELIDGGSNIAENRLNGRSNLETLPIELTAKVASALSYEDVARFRQTCRRTNFVYREYRSMLKGPEIHVFVSIKHDDIVTSFRGHKRLRGEAKLLPSDKRSMILRNSDVTLTLRLGDHQMTRILVNKILNTFRRSVIVRLQLRADTVSRGTMDLINSLGCQVVELNIGRFSDNVPQVRNIKDLKIRQPLLFFQLILILRLNLSSMSVRGTAASLPLVLECINEWRAGRREIISWFFKMPRVDITRDLNDAEIDWRRSVTQRIDGSARLRMNTKVEPLEAGELVNYQTVSWLLH